MLRLFLTFGLFFVGVGSVSAQISIRNFTDETNDRFENDSSFIGNGFDFSGVARSSGNGKWGTLIGPNAVLTAQHARPGVTSILRFYLDNDPDSTPYEAVVTHSVRVGSTDLSIVFLDRNVNPSIAVYDFATEEYSGQEPSATQTFFNTDPAEVGIVGERVLVFGVSEAANPDTFRDQAVGENLVFAFSENVVFGSNADNDSIILENDAAGSANALTYETHVRAGDSGAPNFLIDSATNGMTLLGVSSFRLDGASPSTFQSTGITYTGNQVEEINEILSDPENLIILGDCNLDDRVNFLDISPFISLLTSGDYLGQADMNRDGKLTFIDISSFIRLLSGG